MYDGGAMHDASDATEKRPAVGELCQACGELYQTVYMVPDAVWDQIAGGANLLCLMCADRRARKLGIRLYWEAEVDEYPRDFRRRLQKAIAEHRPVLERLADGDTSWTAETHGTANDVITAVVPHEQP